MHRTKFFEELLATLLSQSSRERTIYFLGMEFTGHSIQELQDFLEKMWPVAQDTKRIFFETLAQEMYQNKKWLILSYKHVCQATVTLCPCGDSDAHAILEIPKFGESIPFFNKYDGLRTCAAFEKLQLLDPETVWIIQEKIQELAIPQFPSIPGPYTQTTTEGPGRGDIN